MSAFMVNTGVMAKVVTAILQNTDEFAAIETFRGHPSHRVLHAGRRRRMDHREVLRRKH